MNADVVARLRREAEESKWIARMLPGAELVRQYHYGYAHALSHAANEIEASDE